MAFIMIRHLTEAPHLRGGGGTGAGGGGGAGAGAGEVGGTSNEGAVKGRLPSGNISTSSPGWHGVLHDLYRLHVRGMAGRGLLEHVHVSKAAGSTMCQVDLIDLDPDLDLDVIHPHASKAAGSTMCQVEPG